jgi:hypothetical protein
MYGGVVKENIETLLEACKKKDVFFKTREELLEFYWMTHPRFVFFKTIPYKAKLLDIGASDGSLIFWKKWGSPVREDIEFYANDIKKGQYFNKSKKFFVQDLSLELIAGYDSFFTSILASHVLEHIEDWSVFLQNTIKLLASNGLIYIELPTPESYDFPSLTEIVVAGIPVSTINFFDDRTHIKTTPIVDLTQTLTEFGLKVVVSGVIENEFLAKELLRVGYKTQDSELCTYGVWLRLGFSQYLIARKVK